MPNDHPILNLLIQIIKWFIICLLISGTIGSVTAFFLHSLDWVTQIREKNSWIFFSLPFAGLLIGYIYHQYGETANKGNNQIIEAHQKTDQSIPLKMAPLVYIGTILTHFAGGSAGREGTALQMGASIAYTFTKWFKLNESEKKTIIIMGVSAGFAAVFGTPLTGAIFALEIMGFKFIRWQSIIPSIAAAYIAHFICLQWNIEHSIFTVNLIPDLTIFNTLLSSIAGILFGITALLFSISNHFWENIFNKISNKPLRPFIGGIVIIGVVILLGTTKYNGLGIQEIINAFNAPSKKYDFIIKLLLTSFTLSVGFKGGEVTPLFFIGASLGSALFYIIPLPFALLASMGFVAVFAGATHCVIASIVLGLEIFGIKTGVYIGIASIASYFSSGPMGIYSAKLKIGTKFTLYNYFKRQS